MANGDEPTRHYQDATTAQLGERVTNMGRRINDVEVEMRSGFNQVNNSLNASTNETRQAISALSNNLAERNKTQWPVIFLAIGVASSVLGYFVTQALTPIRDANLDMKAAIIETQKSIQALAQNTVSRQEMDWRSQRGAEDRLRMEAAVTDIRSGLVPRAELERVWQAYDQRFLDQQRQIDDLKTTSASTYNARDVILDMKRELEELRRKQPPAP
ncbi:MAG: hypothetical protein E5V66_14175 [Mesorhizobium sp.]|uniref:hypothetical protein n=1 Tax=Mesorhizobium sp. TaxID=1871066 RepID=UPI001227CFD2|nr:hypothetical protein [Mesorhizobium sp.]TIW11307.1 MAG: hypothetical protein E5V66_14175 [Mesorhizobium sp.]